MATTKSEDIRLSINNVRYKKGDGTLYLMAERLGWMPNSRDNFTISHKYSDIKMQKISPEGKAKIQLQIVLHTGDNTTFQFANLEDRTAVKDALLQILPQFKGKIPKDRERKAILLSKNPHLLQLYKDLVETKTVSADDFWALFIENKSDEINAAIEATGDADVQEVGVSADFLAGIPLNGKQVKGTVSVETLWAILKTYPKVAQKHQELVPTKMTETEFWNKFFQSRYFNRDRTKDLFSDCVRAEEREWSSRVKKGLIDPFLDLDMFSDNVTIGTSDEPPPTNAAQENSDQLLIKRFNQQSIRLVESLQAKSKAKQDETPAAKTEDDSQQAAAAATTKEDPTGQQQSTSAAAPGAPNTFRSNRRDWTYDDLAGHENVGDFSDEESRVRSMMHEVDRDLYSIVPQASDMKQSHSISASQAREHCQALQHWEPNLIDCMAPKDATEALKNLLPAGYLMRSSNLNRLHDSVPEDLQARLRGLYLASNELLRHFWLCFPVLDSAMEAKLIKLHDTLKKFEATKLQGFHDGLSRDQRHLLNHILRGQFKAASRKFELWRSKRRLRVP